MDIKAIETVYEGYRFRSRLEARWAVFFDTLGLKWEYEPEGFELPSGWYLPDFLVHYAGGSRYFEVKGDIHTIGQSEWQRMLEFDDAKGLILLDGTPELRTYCGARMAVTEGGHEMGYVERPYTPNEVLDSDRWGWQIAPDDDGLLRTFQLYNYQLFGFWCPGVGCSRIKVTSVEVENFSEFSQAVTAARSARFEHNERASMARA